MHQPDDPEPDHTCRHCNWRVFIQGEPETGQPDVSECHRHAPIVTGGMMSNVCTVWPAVSGDDWCGDFEHIKYP